MWINIKTNKIYRTPKPITINGVTYPKQIWRDRQFLKDNDILPYREEKVDTRYYWQGAPKPLFITDTEAVQGYESIPKLIEDRAEVDEDGEPILDEEW